MKKTQAIKERLNAHREMLTKLEALKQELQFIIDRSEEHTSELQSQR